MLLDEFVLVFCFYMILIFQHYFNHICKSLDVARCAMPVKQNGPRQANLVLIAYASSDGPGEPAHPRILARTFAARSYKQ